MDTQTTQWLGNVGATHDRFTVDPVMLSLPEAEQKRIMALEGAGIGLEGRKLIVQESLKALEKHWKSEGAKDAEAEAPPKPCFPQTGSGRVSPRRCGARVHRLWRPLSGRQERLKLPSRSAPDASQPKEELPIRNDSDNHSFPCKGTIARPATASCIGHSSSVAHR